MRLTRLGDEHALRWMVGALAIVAAVGVVAAIENAGRREGRLTRAVVGGQLNEIPDGAAGFFRCESLRISWRAPSQRRSSELRVHDEATGKLLLRAADEYAHYAPQWCGDILQDGSFAFGYSSFSGGAHCCTTHYVLLLGDEPRVILETEPGEGHVLEPEQLDSEGPYELVGSSDALSYFDPGGGLESLSFVASPMLPAVYAFEGGKFVEATRRFPEVVEDDLREALVRITGDATASDYWEDKAGYGLRALGDLALLGRLDDGLDDLRAGKWGIDVRTSYWLVKSVPALEAAIDSRFE